MLKSNKLHKYSKKKDTKYWYVKSHLQKRYPKNHRCQHVICKVNSNTQHFTILHKQTSCLSQILFEHLATRMWHLGEGSYMPRLDPTVPCLRSLHNYFHSKLKQLFLCAFNNPGSEVVTLN